MDDAATSQSMGRPAHSLYHDTYVVSPLSSRWILLGNGVHGTINDWQWLAQYPYIFSGL